MRVSRFASAVVGSCAALALLAALGHAAPGGRITEARNDCLQRVAGIDLQSATIPQLQRALASGRLTSRQLVAAFIERIKAYDPKLNSIRYLNPHALEDAAKTDRARVPGTDVGYPPLFGIPILLKDNVDTKDMPTTAGSIALKGSVPLHDAVITKKLRAGGAIILGKANLSEFAGWVDLSMPPGYSSLGGQVVNPYNYAGTPSGSSAGSGVASTMAFASATVGTETSGSILSPSDANSDVGIKPTTGLVSRTGILPLAPSFDTAGPIARNVTDAATLLSVLAGRDPKDARTAESKGQTPRGYDYTRFLKRHALKGVRLGYSPQDRDDLNSQQQAVFDDALKTLRDEGATLVETDQLYGTSAAGLAEIPAIPNEFKASLNGYLATEVKPSLRVHTLGEIVAYNQAHPKKMKYGQKLLQASDATQGNMESGIVNQQAAIQSARGAIDSTLIANDLDAIVAPGPAYANVSASAGYPTVIVPGGYTNEGRTPMGISFLASAYDEPQLISYAYDYEHSSHRRIPAADLNPDLKHLGC